MCKYGLIDVSSKESSSIPEFKSNTYIHTAGRLLGCWFCKKHDFGSNAKETIESLGIEENPRVYIIFG